MKTFNKIGEKGQALITLLFFMVIGIAVISAAATILFVNSLSATSSQQGLSAFYLAESGAEDGILHLLRNPSFSGTYQAISSPGVVSVTVTTGTITSTATLGKNVRKIQAQTVYNSGVLTVSSWKEIN